MSKKKRKQERKRLTHREMVLRDSETTHIYIKKDGLYYRPNSCGYTRFVVDAGIFRKEEYHKMYSRDSCFEIIPIINQEHDDMINAKIANLRTRLLCS